MKLSADLLWVSSRGEKHRILNFKSIHRQSALSQVAKLLRGRLTKKTKKTDCAIAQEIP